MFGYFKRFVWALEEGKRADLCDEVGEADEANLDVERDSGEALGADNPHDGVDTP